MSGRAACRRPASDESGILGFGPIGSSSSEQAASHAASHTQRWRGTASRGVFGHLVCGKQWVEVGRGACVQSEVACGW